MTNRMNLEPMHQTMNRHVQHGGIPGLVSLVRASSETHVDAIGNLALAEPGHAAAPVRADSIFRIASMSKPITAVATLMLVDDGKLALDSPVDRWLPELANRRVLRALDAPLSDTVPAARAITVRDLLTFTWGFGQLYAAPDTYPISKAAWELEIGMGPPAPDATPAPDEWLKRLGSLPLMAQPGERWLYHIGSDVLGVLVARASGKSFSDFLRERLFEPLGMKDTAFYVPASKLARFATAYATNRETKRLEVNDPPEGQWSREPAFPSGGGGLVSTAPDYAAFAQLLLDGGEHEGHRLVSAALVAEMTKDQLTAAQKEIGGLIPGQFDGHGWGFGVTVVTQKGDSGEPVGTYGWDGGLGSCFRNYPSQRATAVLLTQKLWDTPKPPPVCEDFLREASSAVA